MSRWSQLFSFSYVHLMSHICLMHVSYCQIVMLNPKCIYSYTYAHCFCERCVSSPLSSSIIIKVLKSGIQRYAVTTNLLITAGLFVPPNSRYNWFFISKVQVQTPSSLPFGGSPLFYGDVWASWSEAWMVTPGIFVCLPGFVFSSLTSGQMRRR